MATPTTFASYSEGKHRDMASRATWNAAVAASAQLAMEACLQNCSGSVGGTRCKYCKNITEAIEKGKAE